MPFDVERFNRAKLPAPSAHPEPEREHTEKPERDVGVIFRREPSPLDAMLTGAPVLVGPDVEPEPDDDVPMGERAGMILRVHDRERDREPKRKMDKRAESREAERDTVEKMFHAGASDPEIAEELGRTRKTIRNWRYRWGLKR